MTPLLVHDPHELHPRVVGRVGPHAPALPHGARQPRALWRKPAAWASASTARKSRARAPKPQKPTAPYPPRRRDPRPSNQPTLAPPFPRPLRFSSPLCCHLCSVVTPRRHPSSQRSSLSSRQCCDILGQVQGLEKTWLGERMSECRVMRSKFLVRLVDCTERKMLLIDD